MVGNGLRNRMTRVGMNVSKMGYGATFSPMLDRMRAQDTINVTGGTPSGNLTFDSNGYPTLAAGATAQGGIGVDHYGDGITTSWVLTYTRTGTALLHVVAQNGTLTNVVEAGTGDIRTVSFDVTNVGQLGQATSTILVRYEGGASGGRIVSQTCYPVAQAGNPSFLDNRTLAAAGEIFTPEWIKSMQEYSHLRFLDPLFINDCLVVSRATDATLTQASFAANNKPWPLELCIAMCSRIGADLYYNVPPRADDAYVTAALALIRDTLRSDLMVTVEYSNEIWNTGSPVYGYSRDTGAAIGAALSPSQSWGAFEYCGYRSGQVAVIAEDIFKDQRHRLETLINAENFPIAYILTGLAGAGISPYVFDSQIVTFYADGGLQGGNASDIATIKGWAAGGSAGLASAVKQFTGEASALTSNGSNTISLKGKIDSLAGSSDQYGWNIVFYEGNLHLNISAGQFGAGSAAETQVLAMYAALARHPDIRTKLYGIVLPYGFQNFVQSYTCFADYGYTSAYGSWGVRRSMWDTSEVMPLRQVFLDLLAAAPPRQPLLASLVTSSAKVGTASSIRVKVRGGTGSYKITAAGTLPPGTAWQGKRLIGTPTQAGAYPFTLSIVERSGKETPVPVSVTVTI